MNVCCEEPGKIELGPTRYTVIGERDNWISTTTLISTSYLLDTEVAIIYFDKNDAAATLILKLAWDGASRSTQKLLRLLVTF